MPLSAPDSARDSTLRLQIFFLLFFIAVFFFLTTNGIPLAQMDLIPAGWSKTRFSNLFRIPFILFILCLAAVRVLSPVAFRSLWISHWVARAARHPRACVAVLTAAYFIRSSVMAFFRHAAWETRAFDLGIFAQAVWNTIHGRLLYSSIKEGINLMGDHFGPILLITVPFYALWDDPRTLLLIQNAATSLCIPILYFIARERLGSSKALIFCLAFFFYVPARAALREDFHPEVLVEPFMLLAFFFLMNRKMLPFFLMLGLILAGKENMAGITFILGFFAFVFCGRKAEGAVIMAGSILYLCAMTRYVIPQISGAPYLYSGFYASLLKDPLQLAARFFSFSTVCYVFKIFVPLLGLSFAHLPSLTLTAPVLAQNLLSANELHRSLNFHYTVGLTPFVFLSAIYGWGRLQDTREWFRRNQGWFMAALVCTSLLRSGPSEYFYIWKSAGNMSEIKKEMTARLAVVPASETVLTHNNVIPQMIHRPYIYQFDYNPSPSKGEQARARQADIIVLSRGFWEPKSAPWEEAIMELRGEGYKTEFERGGWMIMSKEGTRT